MVGAVGAENTVVVVVIEETLRRVDVMRVVGVEEVVSGKVLVEVMAGLVAAVVAR